MSATATDIQTILEKSKPREPQKCHTIDHRGYALCGAFGPCTDADGNRLPSPTAHSHEECVAKGHKHCLLCTELDRQMGDNWMVA